jgi:uncharacterized delta-60 repeat protein
MLTRYNTDGLLDTTFGNNGFTLTNFLGGSCNPTACALHQNGQILVGGSVVTGPNNITRYLVVVRYNAEGSLDTTFASSGKYLTSESLNLSAGSEPKKIVALSNNQILIVANLSGTLSWSLGLFRFNSDGTLDNTYYNNGIYKSDFDLYMNGVRIRDAIELESGKIFIAAHTHDTTQLDVFLARLNTEGVFDSSFGTNGYLRTDCSSTMDNIGCAVELDNGKIAITNSIGEQLNLALFDTSGTLLGEAKDHFEDTYGPWPSAIAKQTDGKILLVGNTDNAEFYLPGHTELVNSKIFLVRYISDLALGFLTFNASETPPLLYPNPLQNTEVLKYTLADDDQISIVLLDGLGKLITTFVENENQPKGDHEVELNLPTGLQNGTYFIQIVSPRGKISIKTIK